MEDAERLEASIPTYVHFEYVLTLSEARRARLSLCSAFMKMQVASPGDVILIVFRSLMSFTSRANYPSSMQPHLKAPPTFGFISSETFTWESVRLQVAACSASFVLCHLRPCLTLFWWCDCAEFKCLIIRIMIGGTWMIRITIAKILTVWISSLRELYHSACFLEVLCSWCASSCPFSWIYTKVSACVTQLVIFQCCVSVENFA